MTGLNAGAMMMIKFGDSIRVLDCFATLPGKNAGNIAPPKRSVKLQ